MKKVLIMLVVVGLGAASAYASGGVGVFVTYLNSEDLGGGWGGGLKFKADVEQFLSIEARGSVITAFDDWAGDDELYLIPIEGDILLNFPLGDGPLTVYGGGGGGFVFIPEVDDVDFDDTYTLFALAGVEIALGDSASLFVEAQYRFLEVDGAEAADHEFDTDLELSGFGGNAGLLFRF